MHGTYIKIMEFCVMKYSCCPLTDPSRFYFAILTSAHLGNRTVQIALGLRRSSFPGRTVKNDAKWK